MRNILQLPLAGLFLSVFASGCAWLSGDKTVPLYAPKPILMVNGSVANVVFIPDFSKAYQIGHGAFLAKSDLKLTVNNGMLSELDSKLDSSGFLTFLEGAVTEALKQGEPIWDAFSTDSRASGQVRVYDFVFDQTGNIIELREIELENLPISETSGNGSTESDDPRGDPPEENQ